MKVSVKVTGPERSGVSRKAYDGVPSKEAVEAQVRDAFSQANVEFASVAKKRAKKAAKKAS